MNELQFCYWLKGHFELSESEEMTPEQVAIIKEHLGLVFTKVTLKTLEDKSDYSRFYTTPPVLTC